jgi:hypothetical protein
MGIRGDGGEGAAEPARVCRVVVAVDGADDLELVAVACAAARRHNARLEVVGGVPQPGPFVALVAEPTRIAADLERDACALLRAAVERVDPDLPVTARLVRGRAARRVARDATGAETDLVVLQGRQAGRRARWRCVRPALWVSELPVSGPAGVTP